MLFLTNFQHVNGSFMKKRTPTKTNDIDENDFWSLNRQTVFLQNWLNHIRLLSSSISDTSNNIFQQNFTFACLLNFYWISPNKKFVLHKY